MAEEGRLNPQYLQRAKDALKMAKSNLKAAECNALEGDMRLAGADLVVAGEEVVRARVLFAVYEDIFTFDAQRKGERVFVSERELGKDHVRKYELLVALSAALMMALSLLEFRQATSTEKDAMSRDSGGWIQKRFSGTFKLLGFSEHLEELRQGRYSGLTTKGTPPPLLDQNTFKELYDAIEEQASMAEYEQEVYKRPPEELSRIQALLPGVLTVVESQVQVLKEERARGLSKDS
ncbi:MAG: hypothetical protein JRN35_08570 [Nitrososphaerota archaeon]|nr:hypothetical protein [Nitrososphaerota archaeon]